MTKHTDGSEVRHCGNAASHSEVRAIPASGHKWGKPSIVFSDDGKAATADWTCANDAAHRVTRECEVTCTVTKQATLDEPGQTTYTATVGASGAFAGGTASVTLADIPALGRKYGPAAISFSEDGKSATASWTCTEDPSDVRTRRCSVSSEVTRAATCAMAGQTTYTATAAGDEALGLAPGVLSTVRDDVPALGHDLVAIPAVDPTCESAGATAGEHCARCDHEIAPTMVEPLGHDFGKDDRCSRCAASVSAEPFSDSGYYRIVYIPAKPVAEGCATYLGARMAWDPAGKAWVAVVGVRPDAVALSKAFGVSEEAYESLPAYGSALFGDVNRNGVMNIVDAQVAYNLVLGAYSDSAVCSLLWLRADVNRNHFVDASDAFAIQRAVHYGWS